MPPTTLSALLCWLPPALRCSFSLWSTASAWPASVSLPAVCWWCWFSSCMEWVFLRHPGGRGHQARHSSGRPHLLRSPAGRTHRVHGPRRRNSRRVSRSPRHRIWALVLSQSRGDQLRETAACPMAGTCWWCASPDAMASTSTPPAPSTNILRAATMNLSLPGPSRVW